MMYYFNRTKFTKLLKVLSPYFTLNVCGSIEKYSNTMDTVLLCIIWVRVTRGCSVLPEIITLWVVDGF